MKQGTWLPIFFAIAACSWMPHWTCHYYRLETTSSFVVGSWEYSRTDSVISMIIYAMLIALNLLAVSFTRLRFTAALVSGILHLSIACVHIVRLSEPFRFEVFGFVWSYASSIREMMIVFSFGIVCLLVARILRSHKGL